MKTLIHSPSITFLINVILSYCLVVSMKTKLFREIARNFKARTFNVENILLRNPHIQTIVGSEALRIKFSTFPRDFTTRKERWNTPDGDFVDLEFTTDNKDSNAIVVILHGLESNPESPQVTKMTRAFLDKGYQCCLFSFRSCSSEDNISVGAYHLGFTDDIDMVTKRIRAEYPKKSIYLSGFSLGGNVICKFLGELGDNAVERNILGASVTCVPFDPVASQVKLDQGFNRAVYSEVTYTSNHAIMLSYQPLLY